MALVVLLLLVLLLPRACDALFTSGDEQGSETSETADVESSGDGEEEESVTEEEAAPVQEEIAEREDVAVSGSDEDDTSEAVGEDESEEVAALELEAGLVGPATGFGGIPGGGEVVGIPQPVPLVGPGLQEPLPPIAPQEPVLVGEPLVTEPIFIEEPILVEEPLYFGEPLVYEDPTLSVEEPGYGGAAVDTGGGATTAQTGNAFASS